MQKWEDNRRTQEPAAPFDAINHLPYKDENTDCVASVRRGSKNFLQNSSVICSILLYVCNGRVLNCVCCLQQNLCLKIETRIYTRVIVCVCVCDDDDYNHQVTDISLVPVEVLFRTLRIKCLFLFFFVFFFVVLFLCC